MLQVLGRDNSQSITEALCDNALYQLLVLLLGTCSLDQPQVYQGTTLHPTHLQTLHPKDNRRLVNRLAVEGNQTQISPSYPQTIMILDAHWMYSFQK